MAELIWKDCKLYLGQYDLTGAHNAINLKYSAEMKDNTHYGDGGRMRKAGLTDIELASQGYYDGAQDDVDEVLMTNLAVADTPVSICPTDGTDGSLCYFFKGTQGVYTPFNAGQIGEPLMFDVNANGGGQPLVRGTVLGTGAKTSTQNGTARNLGAVASGQYLWAVVHCTAASAGDTLDLTIESDAAENFLSPTTRITFAQITAVSSIFVTQVAGPITDTWWRAVWTIGGVDPSFTIMTAVGIK